MSLMMRRPHAGIVSHLPYCHVNDRLKEHWVEANLATSSFYTSEQVIQLH